VRLAAPPCRSGSASPARTRQPARLAPGSLVARRSRRRSRTPATELAAAHYATFSIAAGIGLFALARRMGTSVEQIDRTYGHLLPDAVEYERGLLDAFDERANETYGHGSGTGE